MIVAINLHLARGFPIATFDKRKKQRFVLWIVKSHRQLCKNCPNGQVSASSTVIVFVLETPKNLIVGNMTFPFSQWRLMAIP